MGDTKYSRPLSELRRSDEPTFGAKSANLGELLEAGIPVPPGFGLSTAAFRAFLTESGLSAHIDRQLASISIDDLDSVGSASASIREAICAGTVPASVQAEIEDACAGLARAGASSPVPVAVRSSAIGEDSDSATFAGQQETFLWVRDLAGVIRAVRDCWASLYSPTAVTYRARATERARGAQAADTPAMGVAVQMMVDARVSGVMFTCNPVSGDPSIVAVNASWGLGEAVVAGEVTPDEFLLSKVTGEVVRQRIGDKQVEHVPAPEGGGTVRRDVPGERKSAPSLSETELRALLDVARRVERHFGSHQDIEWAIAQSGSSSDRDPFILQSRPVTAAPKPQGTPKPASAISLVMSTFGVRDPGDQ
jgi:phosphoenolpyruvate synthase/pyruvate phosphate dikinase